MEFLPLPPPPLTNYISLTDHQSSTPSSFFAGPPVLHHHCKAATVIVQSDELEDVGVIRRFVDSARGTANASNAAAAEQGNRVVGDGMDGGGGDITLENIGIFVTSQ